MNTADEERLTSLLSSLIDISSPTGEEGRIGRYLENALRERGLDVTLQKVGPDRFNLLATNDRGVSVLLCTHMDTVLPHIPSSRRGKVIYGRGACDAKGAMAAMISAIEKMMDQGRKGLGLLFVVGEEKDSDGARMASKLKVRPQYIILGEPTGNRVVTGQKGTIVFQVEVQGKAAHSACPEKGHSAIHHLVDVLKGWITADWGSDPTLGSNTLNIGRISGGVGANVTAPLAVAEGIFRIGTSSEVVIEKLIAHESKEVSIKILSFSEPMRLYAPEGFETAVVSFGSDAPYLRSMGEIVMMGPGSIEYAHGQDEQVTVDQLLSARDCYVSLVEKLSKQND